MEKETVKKAVGFRPTKEDIDRLEYLKKVFSESNPIGRVSNSDVLRYALEILHENYRKKAK